MNSLETQLQQAIDRRNHDDQATPLPAAAPAATLVRWFGSTRYLGTELSRAARDTAGAFGSVARRLAAMGLSVLVLVLVAVTAVAGYWASFIGLHTFAVTRMGYDDVHGWLVPVAIDGAALGLSISAAVLAWRRWHSPMISLLIVAFTAVSAWINYEHIADPVGRQAAALLPFAAVILLEVLLSLLRRLRGGERPRGAIRKSLDWLRLILAQITTDSDCHLLLRALLHPVNAWVLVRRTFTLTASDERVGSAAGTSSTPTASERTDEPASSGQRVQRPTPLRGRVRGGTAGRAITARPRVASGPPHGGQREAEPGRSGDDDEAVRNEAAAWIAQQRLERGRPPTGTEVGAKFNRSARWGRNQLRADRQGAA